MFEGMFWFSQWVTATDIWCVNARNPTVPGTAPTMKDYPAQKLRCTVLTLCIITAWLLPSPREGELGDQAEAAVPL